MDQTYKLHRPISQTKTILKYLALEKDPALQRKVLSQAPDRVYKSICNAFKNLAENNEVTIGRSQKPKFRKHKKLISKIISPSIPVKTKRKIIQHGGNPFLLSILPAAISAAITLFGSSFMK